MIESQGNVMQEVQPNFMGNGNPSVFLSLSLHIHTHTQKESFSSLFLSLHLPFTTWQLSIPSFSWFLPSTQLQLVCGISSPQANSHPDTTGPQMSNFHGPDTVYMALYFPVKFQREDDWILTRLWIGSLRVRYGNPWFNRL